MHICGVTSSGQLSYVKCLVFILSVCLFVCLSVCVFLMWTTVSAYVCLFMCAAMFFLNTGYTKPETTKFYIVKEFRGRMIKEFKGKIIKFGAPIFFSVRILQLSVGTLHLSASTLLFNRRRIYQVGLLFYIVLQKTTQNFMSVLCRQIFSYYNIILAERW